MYVSFETYEQRAGKLSADDYEKAAPIADLVIDHWTLDRVGMAVSKGEELPDSVITVYCSIIDSVPSLMEASTVGANEVSSFSNGIDSYGFETNKTVADKAQSSLGWMMEMLPVEWISSVVSYEGGNVR